MPQPSILIVDDGSDSARSAAAWAERFAREQGVQWLETPPSATSSMVLDIASKEDVAYLVSGLRSARTRRSRTSMTSSPH